MSVNAKRILIDPGHGGDFDGVTWLGRKEKVATLQFSRYLRDALEAKGAEVYLTRDSDKDFGGSNAANDVNNRVDYINSRFGTMDAFISIHCNTPFGRVGPFFQEGDSRGEKFAETLADYYGVFAHEDDFAVLRDVIRSKNKVLFEIAQIDEDWLDSASKMKKYVNQVVNGLNAYL